MRYSKLLLLAIALTTTMCSRRIETVRDTQSDSSTECLNISAAIRPLSFTGTSIAKGTEVLWEVEATGCKGFRMTRPDDNIIKSFTTKSHFTKRYTSTGSAKQEIILLAPIYNDGSIGEEFSVESASFAVTGNGDDGDDEWDDDGDDTNAAFSCRAIPDFNAITARKDSAGNFISGAPWMTFTVITNRPSRLVLANDPADNTLFPSGIPSAQALSTHRIAGQLQKEGLNPVTFRVSQESDPTKQVTCLAPVTVQIAIAPPAPPIACSAYAVPASIAVPVNGLGQPIAPPVANFRVDANRLSLITKIRTSLGNQVVPATSPSVVFNRQQQVPGLGWNTVEFEIADAVDANLKASCSANVWVMGLIPVGAPSCTLSGPDTIKPGQAATLSLAAQGLISIGQIDGVANVLPGTGSAIVFPTVTTTYVGRVNGPTGQCICTKTVQVVDPPSCTLQASAGNVNPGQNVTLTILGSGTYTNAEIDVPGETRIVPIADPKTQYPPQATTTFTGRLKGPGGTAICTKQVFVDPTTVGFHLEDASDWDFNDATVCFNGLFKIENGAAWATGEQTVYAGITKRSACNNTVDMRIYDDSSVERWRAVFPASNPPAHLPMSFQKGWRLQVRYQGGGKCAGVGNIGYGSNRFQINNFCRTTGN